MQSLLHFGEDQGARIVFSGDTRQIPSVVASDALRILERESELKSVSLTEVQRQTNFLYREAIRTMRHSPEEGFAQLEKLGAIREVSIFDRGQVVATLHREFRAEGPALMPRFPSSPLRFARTGKNAGNWGSTICLIDTSHSSGQQPRNRNRRTTKRV
jgi:hypothetical protein